MDLQDHKESQDRLAQLELREKLDNPECREHKGPQVKRDLKEQLVLKE